MKEYISTNIIDKRLKLKERYINFILSQYDKNDKSKHNQNLKYLESLTIEQLEKIYNNLKHF